MAQKHYAQQGIFHVTTNTHERISWCTAKGVPEIIIDNLIMTRHLYQARLYAFCILPDHIHLILSPGEQGLSKWMQSFKSHSMVEIRQYMGLAPVGASHGSHLRAGPAPMRWQKGFHDERIRDERQRNTALRYVHYNAWRHGLTNKPESWPWSSLHFEHVIDARAIM
jgi:putative transposase